MYPNEKVKNIQKDVCVEMCIVDLGVIIKPGNICPMILICQINNGTSVTKMQCNP